jgi:ribosomal protein S18 acetylase RimI-like enzyme
MNPRSFELWRATIDDLDRVAPLFDAYRQFYGLPADLPLCRRFLGQRIARSQSVVFLAGENGAPPSGFTQLYPSFGSLSAAPLWILYDLYVAPDARRMGVGRRLMERARRHAQETGARSIVLSTATTNSGAQALYESLGYKLDSDFLTYELTLPLASTGGLPENPGHRRR